MGSFPAVSVLPGGAAATAPSAQKKASKEFQGSLQATSSPNPIASLGLADAAILWL